jgi:hypothetical protein
MLLVHWLDLATLTFHRLAEAEEPSWQAAMSANFNRKTYPTIISTGGPVQVSYARSQFTSMSGAPQISAGSVDGVEIFYACLHQFRQRANRQPALFSAREAWTPQSTTDSCVQ